MSYEIDISLTAKKVDIEANTGRDVTVSLSDVSKSDLLDHFDISDLLNHFDENKILDHIGIENVKKYFDLIDNE